MRNTTQVLADALFDFDKADLRKDAEGTQEAAIPQIRQVTEEGKHPARVEGHTDGKGSEAYNLRLSKARARSVRDWLVSRQVLPSATEIEGFGKSMPVAPNEFDDGSDNPGRASEKPARGNHCGDLQRLSTRCAATLARLAILIRQAAYPRPHGRGPPLGESSRDRLQIFDVASSL